MIAPEMPSETGTITTSPIGIVPVQEAFSLFTRRSPKTDRPRIQAPDLDTGFGYWYQDFPHPDDFFRPLLNSESILPTNSNNWSRVSIPANDAKMEELPGKQLGDGGVEEQYAALDRAYMEQAVWAPYGNEQFATFVSDRLDFSKAYSHLLFNQDYSAFVLK